MIKFRKIGVLNGCQRFDAFVTGEFCTVSLSSDRTIIPRATGVHFGFPGENVFCSHPAIGILAPVPTLATAKASYRPKVLFLVALALAVTGVRAESGPETVVSSLMSSWNAKDAHAFASQFTDDATFVNVNGTLWTGNKELEQRIANNVAFKSSHAEIKPESLRLIRPDIALMHVNWTITGDPRSPQPRFYLMTMVVSKRDGRWYIVAAQNGSAFDHSVLVPTKSLPRTSLPIAAPQSGEVGSLLTELDNNWNRSDAASLSKLFAKDADLVDASVHRFHGRAKIEEHMADLLAHSLKGTDSRTTVLANHSLGPDLAVLEVHWELKGGDTPVSIMGLRLISHRDGNWRIVAAQDTIARALPPQNP
jgi:uncharacterized protein (TIGR02246 family)